MKAGGVKYPTLSEKETVAAALAVLAAVVGLSGFHRSLSPEIILPVAAAAVLATVVRIAGQKIVGSMMRARAEMVLSREGSVISVAVAAAAFVFEAPLALVLPLRSEFDNTRYELWGFDVDVVWPKREYWIATGGVISILLLWAGGLALGAHVFSKSVGVFALSQMVPMNDFEFYEGKTDGAYIILHSEMTWVLLLGVSIIASVAPL